MCCRRRVSSNIEYVKLRKSGFKYLDWSAVHALKRANSWTEQKRTQYFGVV